MYKYLSQNGEAKVKQQRLIYNKVKDAREKAAEGDLQYFVDLKQSLGEADFRLFLSRANYKNPRADSKYYVPTNSIFKAAITAKKFNICRFLLENGLSPQQTPIYRSIHVSYYDKEYEGASSEIFKLAIDAGADLLKPPFANIKKINTPKNFEYELFKNYNLVITANDTASLDLLYNYYRNYDWNKYVCRCIHQEHFDEREAAEKYLTSIDWLLHTAIRLRSVDCALWALDHGANLDSKVYSYAEKKSKMKTSEYLMYLAAHDVKTAVYRNQSYIDLIPADKLYSIAPYQWGDTRGVLSAIVQKTGLKDPNQGCVFINFLQKHFDLDPNCPIAWDPEAFFNVMKGLSLCWAVLDTYPTEYSLTAKDSKGRDISWYITNMPKMVTLNKVPKRSSWSNPSDIRKDEFYIMLNLADLCQRKYESLLNLDNRNMDANNYMLDYEI